MPVQSSTFSAPLASRVIKSAALVAVLWAIHGLNQWSAHAAESPRPVISTLEQLHGQVTASGRVITSFRVEGVVCAVPHGDGTLVLQDDSATVLLELPSLAPPIKAGDNVVLEGSNSTLTRGAFGIQVGTAPIVDNDGVHNVHASVPKSGAVFLNAGRAPLRAEWFNKSSQPSLQIDYEGPGLRRARIPIAALSHREIPATNAEPVFKPGLEYTAYVGSGWKALPDFRAAKQVGSGVAKGFDIGRRTQQNNCALVFTGYLEIPRTGIYTFHVASADGSRLFVGDAQAQCRVSIAADSPRAIHLNNLSEIISEDGGQQWSQLEGRVNSVRAQPGLAELEISLGQRHVTAVIIKPDGFAATNLLGATVQASGIFQRTWTGSEQWPARLIVPGPEQVRILDAADPTEGNGLLTSVGQIRALSSEQVGRGVPVRIRGIITMANFFSCVLQDASGGIYLPYHVSHWVNQPRPGEVWEFNGVTDKGEFSPVVIPKSGVFLGNAALPRGIRPTWSEFQDGSLDTTLVDIEAAVIEISDPAITLLTRDGTVTLLEDDRRPLPRGPDGTTDSLLGSVVRLQGVYTSQARGVVEPRRFLLGNVSVSVVEPAPADPFLGPVRPVRDLLLFKSPTAAWGRVKVAGVVLHSEPKAYILSDDTGSIRIYTRESQPIKEGDRVEAVGFPQVGGPSPVLLEARTRKTGTQPRPKPVALTTTALLNPAHDAKLVQIEALLLSDTVQQLERVLELQAGQIAFLAKLRTQASSSATLRPGSLVQLTGVYSSLQGRQSGQSLNAFELLLDRPGDIIVLRPGPWWTPQRIFTLAVILAIALMLALAWAALLRRTVARRTRQLKREIENSQFIEQQRLLEQERSRVAQDLHDELGAKLAEVGILGTLANNPEISREKQAGYLDRLSELGRQLVSGLDEIVWAVNPKHDSNEAVSNYLCDHAQEFLHSADIPCHIDVQPLPDRTFTTQERHQLFLAFKEALTNVVKHAQATEVFVRMGGDHQSLWVTVEDNGKGLKPNHPSGDGLANMSNRMKQIGGECEVTDRPEGGTVVTLRVFTNQKSPNV